MNIGLLHPGAMGISLAVSARDSGHTVYWIPGGRSQASHERAKSQSLSESGSIAELCETCEIVISVCPPHAALDVAEDVSNQTFKGVFVDANAISPEKARSIHQMMQDHGIDFVDGGIIGGPAWEPRSTWLYLAGSKASLVADCFKNGLLETNVMGEMIGQASAIKMSFAAYTKGTTALLCAIMAAADEMGVREALEKQWSANGSDFTQRTQNRLRRVTAKAWRFSGEMEEIAATLEAAGLPGGFHTSSAEIYERLAGFKDAKVLPELDEVLKALRSR